MAADLAVGMFQLLGIVGEESEIHSYPGHHASPMRSQQGTVVACLDSGQLFGSSLDSIGYFAKQIGALAPRHSCPTRKGMLGGLDRGVHLRSRTGRDVGNRLLVDR
jgi:hypothetical protein